VSQRVVNLLETVQIQIHHRHGALVPACMDQGHRHPVGQKSSVRKPRQRVIQRQGFQHLAVIAGRHM